MSYTSLKTNISIPFILPNIQLYDNLYPYMYRFLNGVIIEVKRNLIQRNFFLLFCTRRLFTRFFFFLSFSFFFFFDFVIRKKRQRTNIQRDWQRKKKDFFYLDFILNASSPFLCYILSVSILYSFFFYYTYTYI